MATFAFSLLCVVLLSAARAASKRQNDGQWNGTRAFETRSPHCPGTWFVWNHITGRCQCGDSLDGVVSCNEETREVKLLEGYCMSIYRKHKNETVVGNCIFATLNVGDKLYHPHVYSVVSASAVANQTTCASMHRDGTLCGKCAEGYSFPVHSYTVDCVRCNYEERQWWLYLAFAYIPLTIFIIVVFLFRINMVQPKFQACVLVFQIASLPLCQKSPFGLKTQCIMEKSSTNNFNHLWGLEFGFFSNFRAWLLFLSLSTGHYSPELCPCSLPYAANDHCLHVS